MDFLYKQMRGRLSSFVQENEDDDSSVRDKRIQPQKTQSFKGEKKRSASWLQRQFSRQMSSDYPRNGEEYQAAVAAAAFAIKSLEEESRDKNRKRESRGQDRASTKVVSKPEDKSVKFSDQVSKTKSDVSDKRVAIRTETFENLPAKATTRAPSVKKTPTFADHLNNKGDTKPENAGPGKAIGPVQSMKKNSTFGDKNSDTGAGKKLGTASPKPDLSATKEAGTGVQNVTKPGSHYTEADSWEKTELAKIKEKYEKLDTTIYKWENKKKTKSKRALEKIEAELDKKRAKAMENFRDKVSRVDNIAGGARAQAEENRRNEEFKVKEKANKMRLTGKLPGMCLCF